MASATYTAANVALSVVPDMSGFFAEMDRRIRGYDPPPVRPEVEPEVDDGPASDELEDSARSGGLAAAAVAAGVVLGAALGAAIGSALEKSSMQGKLQAQLGGSQQYAADMGKIAGNLYAQAYGENLGEVNDALRAVLQSGAISVDESTDEEIQAVTASVLDLASAFDQDASAAANALGNVMRNGLAPDAQTAMDVIFRGMQGGADKAGDLLEVLNEYAPNFAQLGFSAADSVGLIQQALQNGAFTADQVGDSFREFGIKMLDGSADADGAISGLGLNFGQLQADIAAGGPRAAAAFDTITDKIRSTEDPLVRSTAGVAVFGSMWEDSGGKIAAVDLSTAAKGLGDVEGAAARAGDAMVGPAERIESLKRTIETAVVDFIGGQVIPALDGLTGALDDVLATPGVPEVLGFVFSAGAGVAITLGVIAGAIKVWTAAQWLWNAALAASPLTWVAIVLGALVGALIYAYNTSEDFRRIVDGVFAWVGEAAGRLGVAFGTTMDSVKIIFGAVGDFFTMVWTDYIKPIFDRFPGVVQTTADSLNTIWDTIKKIFGSPVYFVLETVWNQGIGGLWNKAKAFGLPIGEFPSVPTGGIPHFAGGGRVGGISPTRTADDVVARLTAGEFVQPNSSVDYYGPEVMERLRRREIPRERLAAYALGGPVTPMEMFAAASRAVPGTRMTSGYRPGDPGFHGRNRAVDLAGPRSGDAAAMARINRWIAGAFPGSEELIYTPGINLKRGRPHTYSPAVRADHFDHVHWANGGSLGGGSAGSNFSGSASAGVVDWFTSQVQGLFDTAAGGVRALASGAFPPNGTFVGDLPVNAADWAIGKAREFLFGKAKAEDDKAMASVGSSGGAGVQQWTGVVQQALGMLGLSPGLVATTLRRMNQESGGNPRAINLWDSNAKRGIPSKGLMQVIDPTFRAYRDSRTSSDIYDPLANVVASMKYALSRYGSLERAYNRPGGYDQGGELLPGFTPVFNGKGHSETVIPLPPNLVADLLANGRRGGDGASSPAVAIAHATFADPVDVDVLMQRAEYAQRNGGM